jgi:hypothetical protein
VRKRSFIVDTPMAETGPTLAGRRFYPLNPLHGPAAMIGIPSLPIAAMLISLSLARVESWRPARKGLLWTANLTWISLVLMAAAFAVFIYTFKQAGGDMSAGTQITLLPEGVIALVGWSNRLLIVVYCVWVMTVAWRAIKLHSQQC